MVMVVEMMLWGIGPFFWGFAFGPPVLEN